METTRVTGARVRLMVAPSAAQTRPGDQIVFVLTVQNSGDVPDRYRIDVVGLQRLWYDLADTRVALAPDESTSLTLGVHPVATASFVAGRYPFRVRVTSDGAPAVQASVTVDFAVGADVAPGTPSGPAATSESPRRAPATRTAAPRADTPAVRVAAPGRAATATPGPDSAPAARPALARAARSAPERAATTPGPRRAPARGGPSGPPSPAVASAPATSPTGPRRAPVRGAGAPAVAPARVAQSVPAAQPAPASSPAPDVAATPAVVPESATVSDPAAVPDPAVARPPAAVQDMAAVSMPAIVPEPAPVTEPERAAAPEPAVVSDSDAVLASGVVSAPMAMTAPTTRKALPIDAPVPRRIPTWTVLPVLVVLLGAAAVLTLHAASAGPFSTRRPAVAPAAPTAQRAGGSPALSPPRPTPSSNQTGATATPGVPRGIVKGIVAQAPMIGRFVVVKGGTHQPDKLLWDTRHAGRVTLNGVPVAAHGTLLVYGAVAGAAYQLDARDGARLVTARVRVPPGGAARPASAAPVALFNVNAITLSARAGNGPGEEQTIRIVNLGPGSLTVTSVALGGQAPQDFSVRTTCTNSPLPVDGGCAISVAFMPTGRGERTAALIVGDNTAASPHTIAISGRAA